MTKKIQLIIGSTRENRIGLTIGQWIQKQAADNPGIELEIVDLKAENLPPFDAATPPAYAPTESVAGKAWSNKISAADGYIFLTPEYNRSIPSSLKNAIDYLATEWKNKPALVVSYGYIDGGLSANRHLHDIMNWLKFDVAETTVGIHLSKDMLDETGNLQDIDQHLAPYEAPLKQALATFSEAGEPEPALVA